MLLDVVLVVVLVLMDTELGTGLVLVTLLLKVVTGTAVDMVVLFGTEGNPSIESCVLLSSEMFPLLLRPFVAD